MTTQGPLAGVRVLDFTWVLAGPFCTRLLADYGAEVIKVQSAVVPGTEEQNLSPNFAAWNRNKLSVTLNLNQPEGVELAKRLASLSDVVVENFTPRVMENWGLDYARLKEANPDLIMLSLSGMGQTGPLRDYVCFGPTIQALSGLTYLTGLAGRPPIGIGVSLSDHLAGLAGALGVLAALELRRSTGQGSSIDLSQLEVSCGLLGPAFLDLAANGRAAEPQGNGWPYGDAAPHGIYRCQGEDRWCAIAVFSQEEWRALCRAMGEPAWTHNERFATLDARSKHADELDRLVEGWTRERAPEEVMRLLQGVGVAAGVVQNAEDLAQRDPQLQHRGFWVSQDHPVLGRVPTDGSPLLFSEIAPTFDRPAPLLGQHNDEIFRQLLGLSQEETTRLKQQGIIF